MFLHKKGSVFMAISSRQEDFNSNQALDITKALRLTSKMCFFDIESITTSARCDAVAMKL